MKIRTSLFAYAAVLVSLSLPVTAWAGQRSVAPEAVLDEISVYPTTMSPTATAAQNMTALAADSVAAMAAGKTLFVPKGSYPYGTSTQESIAMTASLNIQCAEGAAFDVTGGSTTVPVLWTTGALWTSPDYTVSAIATATSGGDLSTESEVTKLTLSASPTDLAVGNRVAVLSNDILGYNDGDSANFPGEMALVIKIEGSVVYLNRKLNRTYTTANYVRMRNFNDDDIQFAMRDCHFTTNGDPNDVSVTSRPAAVFEVRGTRNPILERLHFDELWAGGPRVNSTFNGVAVDGTSRVVPNGRLETIGSSTTSVAVGTGAKTFTVQASLGLTTSDDVKLYSTANSANYMFGDVTSYSGTTLEVDVTTVGGSGTLADWVLQSRESNFGYIYNKDGMNYNFQVIGGNYEQGRHITNTFLEEELLTITGGTSGATTVFNYTGSGAAPAVDDLVYVAAVGGITECNSLWFTITARTGSASSGTFTIACASTGTWTSGGTAQLFQPDQVHRYGEDDSWTISGITGVGNLGDICDEHNGAINGRCSNLRVLGPVETIYGSINPRAAQVRGAGTMLENIYLERGTQFVNIYSFSQNHGVDNIPVFSNIHLRNQQDKAGAGAYIETEGDAAVTDYRLALFKGLFVDGGAYKIIDHEASSGHLTLMDFNFAGDWGDDGSDSAYMMNQSDTAGVMTDAFGIFDFTDALTGTNDEVRVAQSQGGTIHYLFKYFKNLSGESNHPFSINASSGTVTGTIICDYCVIELDPAATNGTIDLFTVTATGTGTTVTGNIYLNNSFIRNAGKLDSTKGLMVVSATAGETATGNLYLNNLRTDAAVTRSSLAGAGGTEAATVTGGVSVQGAFTTCFTLNPTTVAGDVVQADYVASAFVPAAFTLTGVFASLKVAPTTSQIVTIDLNELPIGSAPGAGTTVLSTLMTIDLTEVSTTTAATPAVISDSAIAAFSYLIVDVTAVDTGNTAAGLEVKVCGYYN